VRLLRKRRGQWPSWPGALESLTGLNAAAADFAGVVSELEAAVGDAERLQPDVAPSALASPQRAGSAGAGRPPASSPRRAASPGSASAGLPSASASPSPGRSSGGEAGPLSAALQAMALERRASAAAAAAGRRSPAGGGRGGGGGNGAVPGGLPRGSDA
jgi:hypothetical protein